MDCISANLKSLFFVFGLWGSLSTKQVPISCVFYLCKWRLSFETDTPFGGNKNSRYCIFTSNFSFPESCRVLGPAMDHSPGGHQTCQEASRWRTAVTAFVATDHVSSCFLFPNVCAWALIWNTGQNANTSTREHTHFHLMGRKPKHPVFSRLLVGQQQHCETWCAATREQRAKLRSLGQGEAKPNEGALGRCRRESWACAGPWELLCPPVRAAAGGRGGGTDLLSDEHRGRKFKPLNVAGCSFMVIPKLTPLSIWKGPVPGASRCSKACLVCGRARWEGMRLRVPRYLEHKARARSAQRLWLPHGS